MPASSQASARHTRRTQPHLDRLQGVRPEVALLGLAVATFVFHHLPTIAGAEAGDWVDLPTPFVTIGAAAVALLTLRARPAALALAVAGGILYAGGHGIHLAANSIRHEEPRGAVEETAHFWDEIWGHIEWHSGWFVLLAAIAIAEALSRRPRGVRPPSPRVAAATVLILGFTLFSNSVEGGTWWLVLIAAAGFAAATARAPRPLLATIAGAFALASALIAVWAIWHRGVPQFSELGWF